MPPAHTMPLDRWFVVEITAKSGSGASAEYEFEEVWVDSSPAVATKTAGRYGTAVNYGFSVGAELEVGDRALCRSADGAGGLLWELVPFVGGGASSGGDAHYLAPVRVATTTAGTLATSFEAGDTVDGVTLATGDRILIKDQLTATENGVYVVAASGAPTRASDADTGAKLLGAIVPVIAGTVNATSLWQCANTSAPLIGTNSVTWARIGPGAYWSLVNEDAGGGTTPVLTFGTSALQTVLAQAPVYFVDFADVLLMPQPGVVLAVANAASGQSGVVNTLAQTFTGAKTFEDNVVLEGTLHVYGISQFDGNMLGLGNITASGIFRAGDGGLIADGLSGTLGPGAAATGGIITTLGTGSFVGTASANTFTNTNTFPNTGLVVKDTDDSHGLTLAPGSNLTAGRTLTLTTGDASRTLDISAGNVTITAAGNSLTSAANAGAQRTVLGLGTADSPTFAGGTFSGAVGVTGTLTATTFSGSGASLTALPSSQLTGALPAISGTALTSLSSSALTGALPAISGASLTSLNASSVASGTLAVDYGGTGRTSHTAYAVLCGGTTSTGAQQSIAGLGSVGDVLMSNGAGALPTFQTPASSLNITGLTAADPADADEVPVYSASASANRKVTVAEMLALAPAEPPGRLTLSATLPVTTSDVTSSAELYYLTGLTGSDRIRLWDGTRLVAVPIGAGCALSQSWGTNAYPWDIFAYHSSFVPSSTDTGTDVVTLAVSSPPTGSAVTISATGGGLTASTVYYWRQTAVDKGTFHPTIADALANTNTVNLTASVTGTITAVSLESLNWSSATGRATALATTGGAVHKSGDRTRLYLGSVQATTGGAMSQTGSRCDVWNMYHRRPRTLRVADTADLWTYGTAAYRPWNNSTANRVHLVIGLSEDVVEATAIANIILDNTNESGNTGIGIDSTTVNAAQLITTNFINLAQAISIAGVAHYSGYPGIGYHYIQQLEYARIGTVRFDGDGGAGAAGGIQSGLTARVWA